jgi:hypothetical protein
MQSLQVAKTQLQEAKRDCFIIAMQTFLLHQLQISCLPIAGLKSFTHSSAFFFSHRLYAKTAFHSPIVSHIFQSFTLFAHWKSLECDTYTHAANWLETHTYVLYVRWLTGLQLQLGRWCKQNHSLRHIPLLIQRELCNSPRVYVRSARIRCVPAE